MDTYKFQMNFVAVLCMTLFAGMISILIAGFLHTFKLAKYCICPRYADDVSFYKLILYFIQICNFWSDIYLFYALCWMINTYSYNINYLIITIILFVILLSILIINIIFVYKWLINWFAENSNPYAATWLFERNINHWFYALICLSASIFHTILVVNCKIFGVNRTNQGISQWILYKICRNKYIVWLFYGYSLLMLMIQTSICILIEGVYIINIISTVFTVLSMIIFSSYYYCFKNSFYNKNIYDSSGLEIVYFQLNVECCNHHNDDEYKLIETKEMRNKWKNCIKNQLKSMDTNNNNIKIQIVCCMESANPNDQKFIIYGVMLDLDSYWIHLIEESIQNQYLGNQIQNEFELGAKPNISLIKDDELRMTPKSSPIKLSQHFLINSVDDL